MRISSAASGRNSGRDGAETGGVPSASRALILRPEPARRRFAAPWLSHGLLAATVAVVMGTGFVAGTAFVAGRTQPVVAAAAVPHAETQMDVLYRVQGEVRALKASLDGLRANAETRSQEDAIRGLKRSVDLVKQDLEGVRTASSGAIGQLGAKIDRLDHDPGPKLAEISARLDRLDRDPGQKLADLSARLDRLERQVASPATTGSIVPPVPPMPVKAPSTPVVVKAPPTPVPAKSLPTPIAAKAPPTPAAAPRSDVPIARQDAPSRPDSVARAEPPKPATLDGWMLRDVYNGMALVEGRGGGLREVAPGEFVPGVGEIRSIERRGRSWVVVTSRGVIQADNRW